jgi:hypothetical protein
MVDGNLETMTGGNALKFDVTVPLDIRKTGLAKNGDVASTQSPFRRGTGCGGAPAATPATHHHERGRFRRSARDDVDSVHARKQSRRDRRVDAVSAHDQIDGSRHH